MIVLMPEDIYLLFRRYSEREEREIGGWLFGSCNNKFIKIIGVYIPKQRRFPYEIIYEEPYSNAIKIAKDLEEILKEDVGFLGTIHIHPNGIGTFESNVDKENVLRTAPYVIQTSPCKNVERKIKEIELRYERNVGIYFREKIDGEIEGIQGDLFKSKLSVNPIETFDGWVNEEEGIFIGSYERMENPPETIRYKFTERCTIAPVLSIVVSVRNKIGVYVREFISKDGVPEERSIERGTLVTYNIDTNVQGKMVYIKKNPERFKVVVKDINLEGIIKGKIEGRNIYIGDYNEIIGVAGRGKVEDLLKRILRKEEKEVMLPLKLMKGSPGLTPKDAYIPLEELNRINRIIYKASLENVGSMFYWRIEGIRKGGNIPYLAGKLDDDYIGISIKIPNIEIRKLLIKILKKKIKYIRLMKSIYKDGMRIVLSEDDMGVYRMKILEYKDGKIKEHTFNISWENYQTLQDLSPRQ